MQSPGATKKKINFGDKVEMLQRTTSNISDKNDSPNIKQDTTGRAKPVTKTEKPKNPITPPLTKGLIQPPIFQAAATVNVRNIVKQIQKERPNKTKKASFVPNYKAKRLVETLFNAKVQNEENDNYY